MDLQSRSVSFSSKTEDWETPQWLFDELHAEFGFETDLAASAENAKCRQFYTKADDALTKEWSGVCWCNPPYGRQIADWVKKAAESQATVVFLLPVRTDTKWFHEWVLPYANIWFLKKRIKFVGAKHNAPFPTMICVFDRRENT